jgi:hypothetical protein
MIKKGSLPMSRADLGMESIFSPVLAVLQGDRLGKTGA